jgi:hypothetical protein
MSGEKKKNEESNFKLDYKIENVVATVITEITEKIDFLSSLREKWLSQDLEEQMRQVLE